MTRRGDGAIDLRPCGEACDRPCARSRRALGALLAAMGLAGARAEGPRAAGACSRRTDGARRIAYEEPARASAPTRLSRR